ncbi:MAG: four helix bundle protein [Taibaiella sp.]|nr:four helix bundle protein [Taibaiella sp.]
MEQDGFYRGFKELKCWQEGRELRKCISELSKTLPDSEKYLLISQMNRAARSITANIAEGYGRFTYTETRHFFIQARGSVTELMDHVTVAVDEHYLTEEIAGTIEKQCEAVFKLINGYIAYLDKSKKERAPQHNPNS